MTHFRFPHRATTQHSAKEQRVFTQLRARLSQRQSGFSTLELLIAMTIIILTITAVVMTASGNQSMNVDSELSGVALHIAQGNLEAMQTLARKDFNLVNPTTTVETIDGITYTSVVSVLASSSYAYMTKDVNVQVSWMREGARAQHVTLSALVSNFTHAAGGSTCNSVLTGDWKHPVIANSVTDFLSLTGTSTGINVITNLDAYKGKLYVTVGNTTNKTDPTFFIFDIAKLKTDPTHALLAKLDTATTTTTGLYAVAVAEETAIGSLHAFVANKNPSTWTTCTQGPSCSQLQIIDVSSSTNVLYASTTNYKIPSSGIASPVTGSGGQGTGNAIFYKDGYVYLGLQKTASGNEFNIIDVHDLAHPVWVGSAPIGASVNAINVSGNLAYLATNDGARELIVVDVSNPASPTVVNAFNANGGGGSVGLGQSLAVVGDTVYLGRTNVDGSPELYMLDASSSAATILSLGSLDIGVVGNPFHVNGIVARSGLAFVAGENAAGFRVLDISHPSAITDWATPLALPAASIASSLDCEGNDLFVGSRDGANLGYLSVITASP